jgi:N-acetylneuraminate synthase
VEEIGDLTFPTYIICEAGVNHNGSLETACALVDVAADAGADAVKFQTFRADTLAARSAPKAAYQQATTDARESQYDMLKALELSHDAHAALLGHCRARGIEFLSTPFDHESLRYLVEDLGVARVKIGSGDMTNAPLLLDAAGRGLPVVLSTGMADLAEVAEALGVLAFGYLDGGGAPSRAAFAEAWASRTGRDALLAKVSILHCTTEYPAPLESINLRAMDTLADAFGLPVGLSDHSDGTAVAVAAVGRGARIVEKHLTLDRTMPGPDHRASLEPDDFRRMVAEIRVVDQALGTGGKTPAAAERANIPVARKSLVAARAIAAGEIFTRDNVAVKRPGGHLLPTAYWEVLGLSARRAYRADEPLDPPDADGGAPA